MGANIPTGTIFTYKSSDWSTNFLTSAQDIVSKVAAQLAAQGMTVRDHSESVNGVIGNIDAYLGGSASFTVTLTVQITGGMGYNKIDDPAAIIDHVVYTITGNLPTHSVTDYKVPDALSVTTFFDWIKSLFTGTKSTGQPSAGSASSGFSLSSITSTGTLWIALVVLGFIGALA